MESHKSVIRSTRDTGGVAPSSVLQSRSGSLKRAPRLAKQRCHTQRDATSSSAALYDYLFYKPGSEKSATMNTTPIDTVLGTELSSFRGAFEHVRRRTAHPAYTEIVRFATAAASAEPAYAQAQPRLTKSEASKMSSWADEAKTDIFGTPKTSRAHCFPFSSICCPLHGIFGQAIVGVDVEAMNLERAEEIRTLQQLTCGRIGAPKRAGLRYSPYNLVRLTGGHAEFFDDVPILLLVPIFEDLQQVINWQPGQDYWVMVLIGAWEGDPDYENGADDEFWQLKICNKKGNFSHGERERCSPEDIGFAVDLLTHYVKALADVLYGRGGNNRLVPSDLFGQSDLDEHGNNNVEVTRRKEEMDRTRQRLWANRRSRKGQRARPPRVTIPKINSGRFDVMKVHLKDTGTRDCIPDPANLLYKAGINWSFRHDEKPVSASEEDEVDSEHEEMYEVGYAEAMASSSAIVPPSQIEIQETTARRVTLSPSEKQRNNWETLDDDEDGN